MHDGAENSISRLAEDTRLPRRAISSPLRSLQTIPVLEQLRRDDAIWTLVITDETIAARLTRENVFQLQLCR